MHAQRARDAKAGDGLVDDARAFFDAQRFKGFIFQAGHRMAFVVVAHPAFKRRIAAAVVVQQFAAQCGPIHSLMGKAEHDQPPATGGINTTVSPAAKGADHSANSVLMATFRDSLPSVNP